MKNLLIIAGLDPSGNAGLLRDVETALNLDVKPSAVVTTLTAQNRKKFIAAQIVEPKIFRKQLEALAPLNQFQAIKIGMLGEDTIINAIISFFKKEKKMPPIVLDPVYRSTTGGSLLNRQGIKLLWNQLIPLVDLWTPNLEEASFFSGIKIRSLKDLALAGTTLSEKKKIPILIKGFHEEQKVTDLFIDHHQYTWLSFPRLSNKNLRGTGCTLSTLIASHLALGNPLFESVCKAKSEMHQWIMR